MTKTQVLIVGAGPTGLVLGLWLTRLGVRVRVVDKASAPGQTSRAVGVQARTLEFYAQLGLADAVVAQGLPAAAANLWANGKHQAHLDFGSIGEGLSPYPYMLVYPQDEHEKLLIARLAAAGIEVERPTELTRFTVEGDRVVAQLAAPGKTTETCEVDYLAGCDGARSVVREQLQIGYPGGTYAHRFYVADVQASGPQMNGELHIAFAGSDFLACFPLDKEHTHARLIGEISRASADPNGGASSDANAEVENVEWGDVSRLVLEGIRLHVVRVNWFSTYRVHHRVAAAFRVGRAFLLGDAAHIHSPVGGQGMNTGIGDAVNLAWKIAATLQGRASAQILDSYERERIPFANQLVRTTDQVFTFVSGGGPIRDQFRVNVAPPLASILFRSGAVRRRLFNTISQIKVNYRGSPLSAGTGGSVQAGDRLPWVQHSGAGDNFAPLTSLAWQAHIYGEPAADIRHLCAELHLPVHAWPWSEAADRAGLTQGALYLVRPDGYVALAAATGAADEMSRYVETHRLRF